MSFTLRAKRTLVLAAAGAMVLSMLPGVASAGIEEVCENAPDSGFTDKGTTHADNIDCLAAYDITGGTSATTFGTFAPLTRGQAATLFVNFAVVATDGAIADAIDEDMDVPFTDIAGTTHEGNIEVLYQLGLISGTSATTYSPNMNISREQFATILYNAHVALGVDFDDTYAQAFADTLNSVHNANINALAGEDIVQGTTATTFSPQENVLRGQTATLLIASAGVLDDLDLWDADRLPGVIGPNQDLTANPELLQVTRSGDIVTFHFDQNIPGKSLDFFNTDGDAGSLIEGDEVDYYTGLRLYDVDGTAYYPQEAGIFGDEVRARFVNASTVAAAVRAGVYENTVQNAVGRGNPASDFPLAATAVAPDPIDPYFPQLSFVGNLRDTDVTPAEILVDFRFTFETEASATANLGAIGTWLGDDPGNPTTLADDFAIVGSAGQVFRGEDIQGAARSGANVTVTVIMDPAIEDLPESQLRRGFVEEDAFAAAGLDHILLSNAYENLADVNGTTTDPDLRAVERGTGSTLRFIFDEGVSVPDGLNDNPDLYTVVNNDEERATPTSIGRSLIAADGAQVMVAAFTDADIPGTFGGTLAEYLDTVTAATVDTNWTDPAVREVAASSAARGTNQVGSQQLGWSLPAQVAVTPVQPEVPADPTPGDTDLADLVSVTKMQNAVTGNWKVTFTFDDTAAAGGTLVDFSLYDTAGVRFSNDSRDIAWDDADYGSNAGGQRSFTFGPDHSTLAPVFTNEQIAAAVLGTVQDSEADLVDTGIHGGFEPRITEGHDGIS